MSEPRLVSVREAGEILGIPRHAIERAMRRDPSLWPGPVQMGIVGWSTRPSAL